MILLGHLINLDDIVKAGIGSVVASITVYRQTARLVSRVTRRVSD
jgi:uncharacterized membrane protein YadS